MRKFLFWAHLTAGVTSGIFIFLMCVTGAALTFERQINSWTDHHDIHLTALAGSVRLSAEELLAKVGEERPGGTGLTVYSDPAQPTEVSVGREGTLYVDPYTGLILGQSRQTKARAFFRTAEDLHRWLALDGGARGAGRSIMDAANLVFFGILLSGLYLWIPGVKTWTRFRGSLLFRGGLKGKAREWNWHNVIGIWAWIPLFLIVGSGVVMSYPWASDLLYTMTGSPLPPRNPGGPGPGGRGARDPRPMQWRGLDEALMLAEAKADTWTSIRVQGSPNPKAPLTLNIDCGNGGQPQLRSTLVVDRDTGNVVYTDFSSSSTGQKLRVLARFTHTGESLGIVGQSIAGAAVVGASVMVYTGVALAARRLIAWRRYNRAMAEQVTVETKASS